MFYLPLGMVADRKKPNQTTKLAQKADQPIPLHIAVCNLSFKVLPLTGAAQIWADDYACP